MKDNSKTISLSLVSHTNVGKTTLARTLLSRNVGVVRDEPHVTDSADRFVLAARRPKATSWPCGTRPASATAAGSRTACRSPSGRSAGSSARSGTGSPTAPLWSSQQAVRNARDEADVVLYLVNAAEDPEDAGYVEPEMRILQWIGKPIIVLVNQMGPPQRSRRRSGGDRALARAPRRTRRRCGRSSRSTPSRAAGYRRARCSRKWPALLPDDKRASFGRLHRAWQTQRREAFDAVDERAGRPAGAGRTGQGEDARTAASRVGCATSARRWA